MKRHFLILASTLCCVASLPAAPLSSPLSPEAARVAFAVAPGLRVDLVAAEPQVASPCAFAFDQRGRLFVTENRGYPIRPKEGEAPAGVVAMLEDTDGDGLLDRRTVFAALIACLEGEK